MTTKTVGVFQSRYPVVLLHTVLAAGLLGLCDIDLHHRGGADEFSRKIRGDAGEYHCAMRVPAHRVFFGFHEIAGAQQTVVVAQDVEARDGVDILETAVENHHLHVLATEAHAVQPLHVIDAHLLSCFAVVKIIILLDIRLI